MKRSLLTVPAAAVALALAVAGCGSDGSSSGGGGYGSAPAPASAKAASGAATIKTADHGLGTMLVDGAGRSLYLWKADTSERSTCTAACIEAWPAVRTDGAPKAAGGVKAALLGTTKRDDGSTQVTYAGHPLYTFAGDTGPGKVSGQGSDGFGADWFVVSPGGAAITTPPGA